MARQVFLCQSTLKLIKDSKQHIKKAKFLPDIRTNNKKRKTFFVLKKINLQCGSELEYSKRIFFVLRVCLSRMLRMLYCANLPLQICHAANLA